MTFSVAGVCQETGQVGCVITSSSICVTSRCAFAKSDVGVCLTQNITNPNLGPLGLQLLQQGHGVDDVLAQLKQADATFEWRQLGVLNKDGSSAVFSGAEALGIFATATGKDCLAMGNLLANTDVPQAMVDHFENSTGALADRLIAALEAGLAAGGEMGPVHSAGVLVYGEPEWPIVDLRVDWHDTPISELRSVFDNYDPQMQAYITRALDPANSESYGVPGDE